MNHQKIAQERHQGNATHVQRGHFHKENAFNLSGIILSIKSKRLMFLPSIKRPQKG